MFLSCNSKHSNLIRDVAVPMQSSNSHLQYTIESQRITQKHILSPLALSSTLLHSTLPHSILLCSPVVYSTLLPVYSGRLCLYSASTLLYSTLLYFYCTSTSIQPVPLVSTLLTLLDSTSTVPYLYYTSTLPLPLMSLDSTLTPLCSGLLYSHCFRDMSTGHIDLLSYFSTSGTC